MNPKVVRILGLLIAAAGLALLLSMGSLIEATRYNIIVQNGGSMDTNTLTAQVETIARAYLAIGAIGLAVGLFRATLPERA